MLKFPHWPPPSAENDVAFSHDAFLLKSGPLSQPPSGELGWGGRCQERGSNPQLAVGTFLLLNFNLKPPPAKPDPGGGAVVAPHHLKLLGGAWGRRWVDQSKHKDADGTGGRLRCAWFCDLSVNSTGTV